MEAEIAMKLNPFIFVRGALALLSAAGATAVAQEEEQSIRCKEVPAVVTSAFEKAFPKAKIKGCAREVEDGRTAFEISSTQGKVSRDVLYYADGKLIVVEETIATGSLPEPVQNAFHTKFPTGKITLAEKLTRDSVVTYELQVRRKGETIEVVFDPTGKQLEAQP
jgi:hypothetical protein